MARPDSGHRHPEVRTIQLPAPVRYAIEGMACLAGRARPAAYLMTTEVARRRGLPADYLAKVFRTLARGGLLDARRGPGGGYRLARDPAAISVLEVVAAVTEPSGSRGAGEGGPAHAALLRAQQSLLRDWRSLSLAAVARASGGTRHPRGRTQSRRQHGP